MARLLRPGRRRPVATDADGQPAKGPLPAAVEARVRLSADLLAALLEVEQRNRATLDDLEWADAVAARLLRRQAARQHGRQATRQHGRQPARPAPNGAAVHAAS